MSLTSALQVGRTSLQAAQTAIEVAGNNLANAATRGYHRQVVQLAPLNSQQVQQGVFLGRGVQITNIQRMVNDALEARIRTAIAGESASTQRQAMLEQIEALQNELSDQDLSSQLNAFFNAFSNLANRPQDNSLRGMVVQQGASLASYLQNMRAGLVNLRNQTDADIDQAVATANDLLSQIATLDQQIARADQGSGGASGLRDQRDSLLAQLAEYLEFSVNEQPNGGVDLYVNSLPILQAGQSRGLQVVRTTVNGQPQIEVRIAADQSKLSPGAGRIGAMIQGRTQDVVHAIDTLDQFTTQLIYQVNRIHSQGQGLIGFNSLTGTTRVEDPTAVLNTPAAGIPFTIVNGSYQVHVRQKSTGLVQTYTLNVDLNGFGPEATLTGAGTGVDATFNAVVTGVTASVVDGRLRFQATSSDYEFSFSNDTSGLLAALGINTFFAGRDALDIAVNSVVSANPNYLAASRNQTAGDNSNALALAGLRDQAVSELGGLSLSEYWNRHVADYAVRLGQVKQKAAADAVVKDNLNAQQQAISGVNTDEEAINLLSYQRAYQASARFLTVVDQMYQTLLELV